VIPLRDTNPSRGIPLVNYLLIGACVLAFLYELSLGRKLSGFLMEYGLVPARYTYTAIWAQFSLLEQLTPFLSSMFLHGGWLHLIGNMWTLYIFGDNVESELGSVRYILFYLLSGITAGIIQTLTSPGSTIPTIGASGAIAGVMGAYVILYPRAKILTLVPLFVFFYFVEIPAFVFLGFWFLLQFFNGALSLSSRTQEFAGIAWWAHIGGFVGGILLLGAFNAFSRRSRKPTYYY
jgi:membrane associated rhomboid family serine protease